MRHVPRSNDTSRAGTRRRAAACLFQTIAMAQVRADVNTWAEPSGPWRVMYGGSFNPIHVGHLEIVRRLCAVPGVKELYIVPSGLSPGRQADTQQLLPWDLRYEMVKAAVQSLAAMEGCKIIVSDVELSLIHI